MRKVAFVLILSAFWMPKAQAEEPVFFDDPNLKAAVEVDDDASDDPIPGDASVSDPRENGTLEHPYDSIQEAIEVAGNGTTVRVLPGTYCGVYGDTTEASKGH